MPLRCFFAATTTAGTIQHRALALGDLRDSISKLAYILGIDCTIFEQVLGKLKCSMLTRAATHTVLR
jgi:hypothetical protein